jgi:hypothetical protein
VSANKHALNHLCEILIGYFIEFWLNFQFLPTPMFYIQSFQHLPRAPAMGGVPMPARKL